MKIIGLTGSIGMGKSTVAAMFRKLGVPVFDADAEVRRVQGPGGRALAAIEAAFPGTTHEAGLHRERLGAAVFGDHLALRRLEGILHPLVAEVQSSFLGAHRLKQAVVLDVPLLFEKGGWQRCHLTVVVSAPLRVQRARVLARPGMTRARFEAILKAQMPDAEKRRRADVVIETGRGRRLTWDAVRRIVREL
ncbi:dephospho-CoA kinase [Polymorphobacter multimanifer]|uniref:Dephospho-CoA kinase n=1 Tax=Polymorphobacter multimanifer TaxID=1070431 RepID=A0A841L538_9SPHN|nr:dephospho-CoA kinase [Polymorphobacter multimanifer]MBB6227386.1 dephospho-CoA kinase [Polymorphobacter multimanifer]GGI89217.1 dephospho-CoA kinase [Polymorphobacter multimanifer]